MPSDDASTKPEPVRRHEIFTGAGHRRRWSEGDKTAIVAESYASAETVSEVARRHGLASGQLFSWRRQLGRPVDSMPEAVSTAMFVPVLVEVPEPVVVASPAPRPAKRRARKARAVPTIEVTIDGASVKIARGVDAATIAAVLGALKTAR